MKAIKEHLAAALLGFGLGLGVGVVGTLLAAAGWVVRNTVI